MMPRRSRLTERDASVLDGVVVVYVQVALGLDRHVDQRMARKLVQHMVEEADARRNIGFSRAVDLDRYGDIGFLGLAACFGGTGRHDLILVQSSVQASLA
jgi:hypothetical protein